MKAMRVHIVGWTASFRNPLFISGFQPTLSLPPLSTLYGLLSAAKGDYVTPLDTSIAFVFHSQGKAVDIETVYEFGGGLIAKSNICRREFLFNPELYLYLPDLSFASYFERPHYPLLLGRSTELATVSDIRTVNLEITDKVEYGYTLLPFPMEQIYGPIQALPTHFSAERPRKPLGTRVFYLLNELIPYQGKDELVDPEFSWGVYFHRTPDTE